MIKVKLFSVFSLDLAHNCHRWQQDGPWWFSRIEVRGQDHNEHDRGQTVQPIFSADRAKKKICVFTVRRPTLIFGSNAKLFYGTFSRKWFKYHIFAFQCSFWCLKPLSQLAHDHFTTLCDRNILASHDLSHTLHDHSHSLHLFYWSHQVASE